MKFHGCNYNVIKHMVGDCQSVASLKCQFALQLCSKDDNVSSLHGLGSNSMAFLSADCIQLDSTNHRPSDWCFL